MTEEKEKQIDFYYQLTVKIFEALTNGREKDVSLLLQQRENAIEKMNEIDKQEKHIVINSYIREKLVNILPLEQQIQNMLFQVIEKYEKKMVSARNETFLSKHYEHPVILPHGAFYDKKN